MSRLGGPVVEKCYPEMYIGEDLEICITAETRMSFGNSKDI